MRHFLGSLICGLAALILTAGLTLAPKPAAAYPDQPIRIIVPFGAGDAIDGTARVLADRLQEVLGVSVVVQNVPGAGGGAGALEAARAAPDGYTLLMGSTGALTAGPLMRDAGYTTDDFVAIAQLVEVPIGLAVRAESPYETIAELFEATANDPGGIAYSTPAPGSTQHINMEAFALEQGVELTHIGGAGGSGAVTKAMTGEVDFVFVGATNYISLAQAGELRVLGIAAPERVTYLPDAPTFHEQGYDLETAVWFGVLVRRDTPEEIRARLEEAVAEVAEDPATRQLYAQFHFSEAYLDADAFQERVERNVEVHREVLREIGLLQE